MAMLESEKEILTVLEAAEFLGISERTMRRLIAEQKVPFARVGGSVRLRRVALTDWLSEAERQASSGGVPDERRKARSGQDRTKSRTARMREAHVRAIVGKYADVPFSSEDLIEEKQREKEVENQRWQSGETRF
jgi:excisionase family DNA binding protein